MNKRIGTLLLSIVMMCSLLVAAVPAWAEPADSGVSASVTQASPGETFSVTLKVPGTAKPINEMSLKVHFNKIHRTGNHRHEFNAIQPFGGKQPWVLLCYVQKYIY